MRAVVQLIMVMISLRWCVQRPLLTSVVFCVADADGNDKALVCAEHDAHDPTSVAAAGAAVVDGRDKSFFLRAETNVHDPFTVALC